jgi:hypothetical protein
MTDVATKSRAPLLACCALYGQLGPIVGFNNG